MAWMPTEIEDPSPAMGVGRTLGTHVAVSVGKVSEVFRAATTMDHVTKVSVSEKKVERRSGSSYVCGFGGRHYVCPTQTVFFGP